jgi:hypothetical protein
MSRLLRRRPSPAMVIALLALFIAMAGTGYAATQLPANSVGPKQLKKNAVERVKIKNNAVNGAKVLDGSIAGADIKESSLAKVPSAALADTATNATHAAAAGALDKANYRTAAATAPPTSGNSATAVCDAGQHVVGGGVKVEDPINAFIADDYPDAANTAWTGRVGNAGAAPVAFTVFAICINVSAIG